MVGTEAKEFKTGSRGHWGMGKIVGADGKRYQMTVTIVEIGSKPTNGATENKKKK